MVEGIEVEVEVEVEVVVEGREEDVIAEFGLMSRSKFPKSPMRDFGPAPGIENNMELHCK